MEKTLAKSMRSWDLTWLRDAEEFARSRSKDPSTKVGAVVVSPDNVDSFKGYNGFPMGFPDFSEWWSNRGELATEFSKYDLVIHAEMNAILKADRRLTGWTLYTTHAPCEHCAKHIIAAGIGRVVCYQSGSVNMAIDHDKVKLMFDWGGVKVDKYAKPETE